MSKSSIAEACDIIDELIVILDNAYWESNSIESKDCLYGLLGILVGERSELAKLSVQDFDLPYESVTRQFRTIKSKLDYLRRNQETLFVRPRTAELVEPLITKIAALV